MAKTMPSVVTIEFWESNCRNYASPPTWMERWQKGQEDICTVPQKVKPCYHLFTQSITHLPHFPSCHLSICPFWSQVTMVLKIPILYIWWEMVSPDVDMLKEYFPSAAWIIRKSSRIHKLCSASALKCLCSLPLLCRLACLTY